jgi:hypothetical protein
MCWELWCSVRTAASGESWVVTSSEGDWLSAEGRWPGRGKATEDPGGDITSPNGGRPDGFTGAIPPEGDEAARLVLSDLSVATKQRRSVSSGISAVASNAVIFPRVTNIDRTQEDSQTDTTYSLEVKEGR